MPRSLIPCGQPKFSSIKGKEQIQYSLLKNLGWARLKQGRYEEAKDALEAATTIDLSQKPASAYCLLAQALEELDNNKESLKEALFNCENHSPNPNNPEEEEWVYQAQQKLKNYKLEQ